MSTLQKSVIMALIAAVVGLVTPATAEAKSVVCVSINGKVDCYHSARSCEWRLGADWRTRYAGQGLACVDYLVANKPTGTVVLLRPKGRPATITVDGKTMRIASEAMEAFLDRSFQDPAFRKKEPALNGARFDRFLKEFQALVASDRGISEAGLVALSRELKVPIRDVK